MGDLIMAENHGPQKELTPEQKKEALIKLMTAESAMRSAQKKRGVKTIRWAIVGGILVTLFGIIATCISPDTIYIGAMVVGPISLGVGLWLWYVN
jgi:hypothetical protein